MSIFLQNQSVDGEGFLRVARKTLEELNSWRRYRFESFEKTRCEDESGGSSELLNINVIDEDLLKDGGDSWTDTETHPDGREDDLQHRCRTERHIAEMKWHWR